MVGKLVASRINTPVPAPPVLAPRGIKISTLKQILCTLLFLIWMVIGCSIMLIAKITRWQGLKFGFPLVLHGVISFLFGLRPQASGEPISKVPTLFVANHVTYMDVFVLGKLIRGSYVAKAEVAGWPVFGKLAALQNTLFVERRATKAKEQVALVRDHLEHQGNLIMFPEGTSTAGDYVAKFRSSLFAAAQGVVIQPVTVAYSHYNGLPMNPDQRDFYAWYLPDPVNAPGVTNAPLVAHLLRGLGLGPARVQVIFHKPTRITDEFGRKECAQACEDAVRAGLQQALGQSVDDAELAARS